MQKNQFALRFYLKNWINILTESKTHSLFYMTLLGGYSAQVIKECVNYELKSADNPCVLTNFCKEKKI